MKIKKVEIEGFRAYKHKKDGTFDFTNDDGMPSNFIAIYAPNGFGKSSFYDAVEWAVTNHLDRLGGEYNRTNHDHAAKITKEKGVTQKILRNMDVGKNTPTCVTVFTTLPKPFYRKLKKLRSDARDIRIGDNIKKENEYFRRVILSQEEVDRFLKEAKPQERYKRFMESFGGDAEVTRLELTVLINDNKAVLKEFEKKRNAIQKKLREPVDVSVFKQFNNTVSKLNMDGENLPLIDESFSVSTEHEILSTLVIRAHELEVEREARGMIRDSLVKQLSRLPEVELNLHLITEQQSKLAKLSKGVVDAQHYQLLTASHTKHLNSLQVTSQNLEELIEVDRLAEDFFHTESKIAVATEKKMEFSKHCAHEAAVLENLEQSANKKTEDLTVADTRSLFLRNALDNCIQIYSEIVMHQQKSSILSSHLAKKDLMLSLEKAQYDSVEAELAKISGLKITVKLLLTSDLSSINFDKLKLQELSNFSEELSVWALHDQAIKKTQESLSEQMGLHERLTTTGLQYLSLWPTSTCPLCHQLHDSKSALNKKVENTNLLSSLSKENASKLAFSAKYQKELTNKIDVIVLEALEIQMQRLDELRTKLNELGTKISKIRQEKSERITEKQTLESQIKSLQKSVWWLTKEEFVSRVQSELRELSEIRTEYISQITKLKENIDVKKLIMNEKCSSIKALNLQLKTLVSNSAYKIVSDYLKKHDLSSHNLRTYCTEKLADLKKNKEKYKTDTSQLNEQCKALQDLMLTDGSWVRFDILASQKEQVEIQITKSKSFSEAFFESVNRTIGSQTDKTIEDVKDNISKAIDTQILQYQFFNSKLRKIEMLSELLKASKPYLTSLSLRGELEDIDFSIFQRNHVDAALTAERKLVITELGKLIRAFFYEDLINSIYKKIDPHPFFKKVEFHTDFMTSDSPGLNIVLSDVSGNSISPILYFSTAQMNVLSLSVFLAGALYAKDDDGNSLDVIMIDDPIQSMDSINILATIDLLRSISVQLDKQIIISTHDNNFFELLQRKIPSEILGSKFLELEKFGVVIPVEPLTDR